MVVEIQARAPNNRRYVLLGSYYTYCLGHFLYFPIYVLVLSKNIFFITWKIKFFEKINEKKTHLYVQYDPKNVGCNIYV